MLTLLLSVSCSSLKIAESSTTQAIPLPPPPPIDPNSIFTALQPDSIPAIDEPKFDTTVNATDMEADERVIGLSINGDHRAYPINILSTHEIVNDVVGGQPVAVTWCPLCYSALVFSREVDDLVLTFGVSGKLLENTLVMFDRETNSLWSQLYGGGIKGTQTGTSLSVFPSTLTTWEAWQTQYPDSQVLSKRQTCSRFDCGTYSSNPRGSYEVDPYSSYYGSTDAGIVNRQIPREAGGAQAKKRVLGVRIAGIAQAYPFEVLADKRIVNDTVGNMDVVVWFEPSSQTGTAFQREVNGRSLTFSPDPENSAYFVDETGQRWVGLDGTAVNGNQRLTPVIYTPAFDFGWYGYFPESSTYASTP